MRRKQLDTLLEIMNQIVDDHFGTCDKLQENKDESAQEYCEFGADIEMFCNLFLSLEEGRHKFVENVCEMSRFYEGIS